VHIKKVVFHNQMRLVFGMQECFKIKIIIVKSKEHNHIKISKGIDNTKHSLLSKDRFSNNTDVCYNSY
jgi:hypothetical protein